MKYLIGIPCLTGGEHCNESIRSTLCYGKDVTTLIIDNGATQDVKEVISRIYTSYNNVDVIHNPENIYVNPAWNQIIDYFLKGDYDYLLIMNSDLVLHKDWKNVLDNWFLTNISSIPVPVISNDKRLLDKELEPQTCTEVHEGTPGVLIILSRMEAQTIFPIPESIKVWFGDNWIYEGLRKLGYKTIVLSNLITYHSGSQTVSRLKGISEIIEEDKIAWEKLK